MVNGKHEAATVAAISGEATPRIEIVGERRRAHDAAFRSRVVADTFVAGARVQHVAQRHGVCPSLVYRWRRATEADIAIESAMRLFPVRISTAAEVAQPVTAPSAPPPNATATRRCGLIQIELVGGVRVSVDESVNLAALRRVMSVLRER